METIQPFVLEIYRKTKKEGKILLTIHILTKQTALNYQGFKSSQHIVAIESILVSLQQEWPLTMEKIN